jgi:dihydropteroate synthase
MGVVNVTPDSFSDGGEFFDHEAAIGCAMTMIAEGAAVIDVGPESTRPGSRGVPADEQIRRALPVIEAIRSRDARVAISIDTRSSGVARAALSAGADMVNDTSALRDDPAMVEVVAASKTGVVLMHRRGTPADMQEGGGPHYDEVIGEIRDFLRERRDFAVGRGIEPSRIVLDPGIGFGKRIGHNLLILRSLDRFVALGQPLLIGASRKRFIRSVLGIDDPKQRDAGSLACAVIAALAGASIIRTHDVRATVEAMRVVAAINAADSSPPSRGL